MKHAGASRAGVTLQVTGKGVRMTIEDNGGGFENGHCMPGESPAGQVLIGVRERLALLGGMLGVETGRARGSTLLIYVPFRG